MKYLPIKHHVHCVCWAWSVFRSDCQDIVITREIKENISHNIFYTTITRAKKYLKNLLIAKNTTIYNKKFNIKRKNLMKRDIFKRKFILKRIFVC